MAIIINIFPKNLQSLNKGEKSLYVIQIMSKLNLNGSTQQASNLQHHELYCIHSFWPHTDNPITNNWGSCLHIKVTVKAMNLTSKRGSSFHTQVCLSFASRAWHHTERLVINWSFHRSLISFTLVKIWLLCTH